MTDVLEKARHTIEAHELAAKDAAVLLMVSGGSDSTALAYLGAALREAGDVGPVAHFLYQFTDFTAAFQFYCRAASFL